MLQFYPDGKNQLEMITSAAMKSGFSGGLVIDYPNSSKAKKYYLVLEAGVRRNLGIVEVKGKSDMEEEAEGEVEEEANEARMNKEKHQKFTKGKKKILKRRELVVNAKQRQRRRGAVINKDTKYTGRKRRPKF